MSELFIVILCQVFIITTTTLIGMVYGYYQAKKEFDTVQCTHIKFPTIIKD
jgi:ABC-type dipeptide/oligopeptide/nickel transport system permease subunit